LVVAGAVAEFWSVVELVCDQPVMMPTNKKADRHRDHVNRELVFLTEFLPSLSKLRPSASRIVFGRDSYWCWKC
jgi:hypothetical protein